MTQALQQPSTTTCLPPSQHTSHFTLLTSHSATPTTPHPQVYWGNGCQIIPPRDAGIAAAINHNLGLWDLPASLPADLVFDPTQQISDSYYRSLTANLHFRSNEANAAAAAAVYTPLHGVGGKYVLRAFKVGQRTVSN
jgi:phosphomannomutase